jgi:hypothetical protein
MNKLDGSVFRGGAFSQLSVVQVSTSPVGHKIRELVSS